MPSISSSRAPGYDPVATLTSVEEGITDQSAANDPSIMSQVGYGPDGTNPETASGWTFVTSAMRRMKSKAARTMLTPTATTMSKATVSTRQAMSTRTSLRGAVRTTTFRDPAFLERLDPHV